MHHHYHDRDRSQNPGLRQKPNLGLSPVQQAQEEHDDDRMIGQIWGRRQILRGLGGVGLLMLVGCEGGNSSDSSASGGTGSSGTTTSGTSSTSSTTTSGTSTSGTTGTITGSVTTTSGTSGGTSGTQTVTVATPALTEGPFFVAADSILRSDLVTGLTTRAAVLNGRALTYVLNLYRLSGSTLTAITGAHIDLWQADAGGAYSDESVAAGNTENTVGESFLRGRQITDSNGRVSFSAIYPGWYISRCIHTHIKIRLYDTNNNLTSTLNTQLFFDDTFSDTIMSQSPYNTRGSRVVLNSRDGIYNASTVNGLPVGDYLRPTITTSGTSLVATFNLALT